MTDPVLDAVIIGAGAGGLIAGHQLKRRGFDNFVILERLDGVGGTWRVNTYPGAGCDVPSHLYSFSFAPKADWSAVYSRQPEILEYLEDTTTKLGLRPHLRLNTEVAQARFDESTSCWHVVTKAGERFVARNLIVSVGQLTDPVVPKLPGLEDFRGKVFHSARWDHGFDLRDKNVAVVGTGASAIQFIPPVAEVVRQLSVFQRSPNWIIKRRDRAYTPFEKKVFARVPLARRAYRALIYWGMEATTPGFHGAPGFQWFIKYTAGKYLRRRVKSEELRAKLTPDYPAGCKRILISDDYYSALTRPNVDLIVDGIARVTADGLVTTAGRTVPADAIIFGTGFESTGFVRPLPIVGRNGLPLAEAWKGGAEAHLGITVAGFPNLYLLYGPNTNLANNSIIFMLEAQANYILRLLTAARSRGWRAVEVRAEVMARFNAALQGELGHTVWTRCRNWYQAGGSGRIVNNWSYGAARYWWRTRRPRLRDFAITRGR